MPIFPLRGREGAENRRFPPFLIYHNVTSATPTNGGVAPFAENYQELSPCFREPRPARAGASACTTSGQAAPKFLSRALGVLPVGEDGNLIIFPSLNQRETATWASRGLTWA